MTKQQVIDKSNLYIDGLAVAWGSNTTLTVAAGKCRDSSDAFDMTLAASATINAAVNGVNGLDTGSFAASKVYAVLLIGDSRGFNATKCLLSLSATAPTMPFGYDIIRRIGWAVTDSSTHFILAYQSGSGKERLYSFDAPIASVSAGTSATFAAIDCSTYLPAVENLPVKLLVAVTPTAASDSANVRPGGSSATTGSYIAGSVATKINSGELSVIAKLVSSVPKYEYKVTGSVDISVVSFVDYL